MRARDEGEPDGWLVCLGETRLMQQGRVECAVRPGQVPVEVCLRCHLLQTLAGERDMPSCDATGPLRSSPDPR
jgi:hypothetical protein